MSAWRRNGAAVRLLAVLCLTAGCAATQQQQQQQPSADTSDTNTTELLDLIARAVRAELRPVVRKLESRMDALNSRLDDQMSQVENIQTQIAEQTVQIAEQTVILEQVMGLAPRPRDCSELQAGSPTGVYLLWPDPDSPLLVTEGFCDMDTDGGRWTVFQRRADIRPRQNFFLKWDSYKRGFGNPRKEFWLGLQYLHQLTSVPDRRFELRIDLADFRGRTRYATYQGFQISSEADCYRLTFTANSYKGDATDSLRIHNNYKFSTWDRDHDAHQQDNCAGRLKGGWWYVECATSNLNGLYLGPRSEDETGILWVSWRGYSPLNRAEMKIRPT